MEGTVRKQLLTNITEEASKLPDGRSRNCLAAEVCRDTDEGTENETDPDLEVSTEDAFKDLATE